jgi:predicted O-methyltransferase YrrM
VAPNEATLAFACTLREAHLKRPRRRDVTAISERAAAWLLSALEAKRPEAVADTGSGFSTVVIRSWADHAGRPVVVHSTDTQPGWLRMTRKDLVAAGLPTDGTFPHSAWLEADDRYDLIFVDHGSTAQRREDMPAIVGRLREGGWLVLDDWHFPHHREPTTQFLAAEGFLVAPLERQTIDHFGRYIAAAWRPE